MTICERMFQIIDQKKLKTVDLAKKLDIKQSVISNWKKRNTNPPIEYIIVICEFLGISVEELITGEPQNKLEKEEQELIKFYRLSDIRGRKIIMQIAQSEAAENQSLISKIG